MKQATIMLIVFGAIFTGCLSTEAESENPFGFETNKHPLEYEYCKKEPGIFRGHGYRCSSAPRPHPDLEWYALQFVEDVGLCLINGIGRAFIADPIIGDFLPAKQSTMDNPGNFERVYRQIVKKYGSPTSPQVESDVGKGSDTSPQVESDVGKGSDKEGVSWWRDPEVIRKINEERLRRMKVANEAQAREKARRLKVKTARYQAKIYSWASEEGFKGLGDVKAIELFRSPPLQNLPGLDSRLNVKLKVHFWLVTSDACNKKIDDKADRAF